MGNTRGWAVGTMVVHPCAQGSSLGMLAPCGGPGLALRGCCHQGLRGWALGVWESLGVLAACVGFERLLEAQGDRLGVLAPCARYWGAPWSLRVAL